MAIQKTEAFVLRTQPFRSSSLIVTVFSRSFGKLKGIVKGVRRERELRGAHYELFTHLDIVFYEKQHSDLHLISESAILESHDNLRTRLESIAYASYYAELVNRLTEVHDPQGGIFELLDFAFRFLPSVSETKLSRLFEIKLLREVGWIPDLTGRALEEENRVESLLFSVAQGTLVAPGSEATFPDARPLSHEALEVLRYFDAHTPESCLKLRVPQRVEHEIAKLMERLLLYHLGSPLKSLVFMQRIQPALNV